MAVDTSQQYLTFELAEETYGIEVIAGRDFSVNFASDSTVAFLVNEAAVASPPPYATGSIYPDLIRPCLF